MSMGKIIVMLSMIIVMLLSLSSLGDDFEASGIAEITVENKAVDYQESNVEVQVLLNTNPGIYSVDVFIDFSWLHGLDLIDIEEGLMSVSWSKDDEGAYVHLNNSLSEDTEETGVLFTMIFDITDGIRSSVSYIVISTDAEKMNGSAVSSEDEDGCVVVMPVNRSCGVEGADLTWSFSADTRTLVISGTGEMKSS